MKRAETVIAESLGWDIQELRECRYQRYTAPAVYAVGGRYFAASVNKPKHDDVGIEWVEHSDQFGTRDTPMKVWVCNAE